MGGFVVEADLILALQSGGITGAGIDNMPLDKAAHADPYRFMALELTEDKAEGHRAWRERRTSQLKGR